MLFPAQRSVYKAGRTIFKLLPTTFRFNCPKEFNQFCNTISQKSNAGPSMNSFSLRRFRPPSIFVQKMSTNSSTIPKEIRFETPSGHISGQVWNENAPTAVLCLHGWQDNSCTFDALAPLFPSHLCVVAIDFQGHGLSSHKPLGYSSNTAEYCISIDRIVKQLGWEKVVMVCHSMGGAVAMLYAGMRPTVVHSLIMIDIASVLSLKPDKLPAQSEKALDEIRDIEEKLLSGKRPSYSFEELLRRAMKSHEHSLTEKGVRTLLKRGSQKLEDGSYCFTYDLQVRSHNLVSLSDEQVNAYAERLECRLMVILAEGGYNNKIFKIPKGRLDIYKSRCSEFVVKEVPGTHHVHLETPEVVSPLVSEFLSEDKMKAVQNNVDDNGQSKIKKFIVDLEKKHQPNASL